MISALLSPALLWTVLAAVWALVLLAALAAFTVHLLQRRAESRRDRLDGQARPLVTRFVLAEGDAEDPELRATLRGAEGALGDRIDERLLSLLGTLTGDARERIVTLLVDRGHPQRLRRRARSSRHLVRASAIRALGALALPADREELRRAARDPSPVVSAVAVRALGAHPSPASTEVVLELLRTGGAIPHLVLVNALIDQGAGDAAALALIRSGLSDPTTRVRAACAQALGELTSTADAPELGQLLRVDPAGDVQLAAATALRRVGRASSVPALVGGTRSRLGPVRLQSALALLALPRDLTEAPLAELARRQDPLLAPLLPGRAERDDQDRS
ncbi:HEAT repeat domain-containing protein [Brachybacterium hainanense]|uniref:HEAT repeat domain-containing protein n=1 Tax=Brachybacterium hainanense TaxID=1541174 RepID=A0ABV6RAF1_9MICO